MYKINLIAMISIVASFAISAFVVTEVFAQNNNTNNNESSAAGESNMTGVNMQGMNMTNMANGNDSNISSAPSQ